MLLYVCVLGLLFLKVCVVVTLRVMFQSKALAINKKRMSINKHGGILHGFESLSDRDPYSDTQYILCNIFTRTETLNTSS